MDEKDWREPNLEQRVFGPDGEDITAQYVSESKADLKKCIEDVFRTISLNTYHKRDDLKRDTLEAGIDCFRNYFQMLKGQTNLSEPIMESVIQEEIYRQEKFYSGLEKLTSKLQSLNYNMSILGPEETYCDSGWTWNLSPGSTIRLESGAYLYAVPPVPMVTTYYMALTQDPVAANIVAVTDEFILLLPAGQDSDNRITESFKQLFGTEKEVASDSDGLWQVKLGRGYLLIDSGKEMSESEIETYKEQYNVQCVVTANSSTFFARLHISESKSLERLLNEIL